MSVRTVLACVFMALCAASGVFAAPVPDEWLDIEFPLQPLQGELKEGWEKCGSYFARGPNTHHPEAKYMVGYQVDTAFTKGVEVSMAFCMDIVKFETDASKAVPTVQITAADNGHKMLTVVRVSSADYEAARACLSLGEIGAPRGEEPETRVVEAGTADMAAFEGAVFQLAPIPSYTVKNGELVLRCGDYFLLQLAVNEILCVFHPDGDLARWAGILYPFEAFSTEFDDSLAVPTIELRNVNDPEAQQATIRLSHAEFEKAHACLPRPRGS